MMKFLMILLMTLTLSTASGDTTAVSSVVQSKAQVCDFMPENDLWIGEHTLMANGMTEEIFNQILDNLDEHYKPIFAERGLEFIIERAWSDGTVNAYAQQQGTKAFIKMFGGLARHQHVTPDGFALVACHEVGHHLAGAPKVRAWASNEGQSDYFATLKCARHIWSKDNNIAVMSGVEVPEKVKTECAQVWNTLADKAMCERSAMGGKSLAHLLASLRGSPEPKFDTPDTTVVTRTNDRHPAGQCRLDTYYQGSLCVKELEGELSETDPNVGTCNRKAGDEIGLRPLCWYKPTEGSGGEQKVCPLGEQAVCDQLCQAMPTLPFCN